MLKQLVCSSCCCWVRTTIKPYQVECEDTVANARGISSMPYMLFCSFKLLFSLYTDLLRCVPCISTGVCGVEEAEASPPRAVGGEAEAGAGDPEGDLPGPDCC